MRYKSVALLVCIALLAGFTALNVDEFSKPSLLSLGFTTVEAPLGMVLLAVLAIVLVVFLASTVYMQSINMIESRKIARELSAQRELADKAEASRFTELRHYLELQMARSEQREQATANVLSEQLARTEDTLLRRLEQSDNTTAAYMGQLADNLERRPGSTSHSAT